MGGDENEKDKGSWKPGELAEGWIGMPSDQDNNLEGRHPYYNRKCLRN